MRERFNANNRIEVLKTMWAKECDLFPWQQLRRLQWHLLTASRSDIKRITDLDYWEISELVSIEEGIEPAQNRGSTSPNSI